MADKKEQLREITERLEQGVTELFTSEKYTVYLKTMAQFHNYSFNNTMLIALQKPDATLVAGYSAWNKKFNRQVKRGEKGIRIIAPVAYKQKEETEKFDPVTNEPALAADGKPETEEADHVIPRFRTATVFDISQTYGDPLPELDTPELAGSVENFGVFMEAVRKVSPVPMRYAEIEGESHGYYSNVDKEIVIREGMSGMQTMKTAVHEVTHAMCHDRDQMEEAGEKKDRMTKEVEAESVAYTVCSYFGLDTSDYSFPYIAGWSSGRDIKELRSSMDFIRKTAGAFIDSMAENLQELQKEKQAEVALGDGSFRKQEAEFIMEAESIPETDAENHMDERLLYTDGADRYAIFQINEDGKGREYLYFNMEFIQNHGMRVNGRDYLLVYSGRLGEQENLESLYGRFNLEHPEGYTGHSLSVSDVVVLNRGGEISAHFVDSAGFVELPDFMQQREQTAEKEDVLPEPERGGYPPCYPHTLDYAMNHGRADDYLESRKLNLDCRKAVEDAIREKFDGMRLEEDAAGAVLEEYGAERLSFVLANTVQHLEYDGRFSNANREWAREVPVPENISQGRDLNRDYVVSSHPAVLDGFIQMAREKCRNRS